MSGKGYSSAMRLLICNFCKTIEEVPDYEGGDSVDPLVEELVRRHNEKDAMAHGGPALNPMRIGVVDDHEWQHNRANVMATINVENKKVGFDAWAYEAMSTYADDALKCYRAHHRPTGACIDWWADSKRIGRPTELGRKVLKDQQKLGAGDPHLCQFCPVASFVQTEMNHRAGLYKER